MQDWTPTLARDAIRSLTQQHVRIRWLLLLLPMMLLSTSMAVVSSGLVSDRAGRVLALASVGTVALVYLRFRQKFGVVVPSPPPPSQHLVRDSLVGLAAVVVIGSILILVWVNVVGLGLIDLAYVLGAGTVIGAGATLGHRWYWSVPAGIWTIMIACVLLRVSRPLTASLYLLVTLSILVAVALEYRIFTRRLTDGR